MTPVWGACGVEGCTDCLPLFNEANEPIPNTDDPASACDYATKDES